MKEQILSHFGLMPDREPEPPVYSPFFSSNTILLLAKTHYSKGKLGSSMLHGASIIAYDPFIYE